MIYDFVIIGGGPAGMMAAARASELGARVLVLEKNDFLGKKLLITGHGRCNLSNASADDKNMISVYGPNGRFLYSAFSRYGVEKTLEFFNGLGIKTKIEDAGRIFPQSGGALAVRDVLFEYLKKNNVEFRFNSAVKELCTEKGEIKKVILISGEEIFAKKFIIACGGKSYPATGSSGDAYAWLKKLGHKVNPLRPALASLSVKEKNIKELEGLSLENIIINVYVGLQKAFSARGDLLFTADGLSGPVIIDSSGRIGGLLPQAGACIKIDLFPDIAPADFSKKMQNDFHDNGKKMLKNYLAFLLPPRLASYILKLSGICGEKELNSISRDERECLAILIKELAFAVGAVNGFEKAMLTTGGLDVKELDPKTMRSRLYKNLYLAGEILDIDGPSGGYNLQICWSTGYAAGNDVFSEY